MYDANSLDPTRCTEKVFPTGMNFPRPYQCPFKRVIGDKCKKHDPAAVEARRRKSEETSARKQARFLAPYRAAEKNRELLIEMLDVVMRVEQSITSGRHDTVSVPRAELEELFAKAEEFRKLTN